MNQLFKYEFAHCEMNKRIERAILAIPIRLFVFFPDFAA